MNICVYCSASKQVAQHYKDMGRALGEWIAQQGHTLVFGGAVGGLMTEVSEGVAAFAGEIIGVLPERIIYAGRENSLVTQKHIVQTMNERKDLLKKLADIFVVLPGSYGTLDELFDVVASGTIGEHNKPLILVNHDGFYNSLLEQIKTMKTDLFIPQTESYKFDTCNSMEECIGFIQTVSLKS